MNHCYLPLESSIAELDFSYNDEVEKVFHFHNVLKKKIDELLGETYLLPDVLKAFKEFSDALVPFINPDIDYGEGQLKEKDMTDKYDIYDKYFEVTRVIEMKSGQFIQQYLDTSAELIDELQYTSMSRGEIAYILKAWEAANEIILDGKSPSPDFTLSERNNMATPQHNDERALYRWKLAHHAFGFFMIFSGYCFDKAADIIQNGGSAEAVGNWLDKAAHLFRGTTACMEFGNSFTASIYRSVIRPDMSRANDEANLPNGFSGTQNLEYVKWRSRKKNLLNIVKQKMEEGSISDEIVDMVEMFRAFYLEDMHIHSIIAGRMVGMEKSLLQEGFMKPGAKAVKLTAADVLRSMAAMREKETAFLMKN
jgi:hypothetical protein